MKKTRRSKRNLSQQSQPNLRTSRIKSAAGSTATREVNNDETLNNAENHSTGINQTLQNENLSLFDRVVSVIRVIKLELLLGLLGLILALGQYFQSGIAIRINITSIWREGYKSEVRDRVSKFRYLYHNKWTAGCHDTQCKAKADETVRKLVSTKRLLSEDIHGDDNIRELVSDEITLLKYGRKPENGEYTPTNEDYVQAALKYRNAIIECLNTAEAVKAVIEARPLPFRRHLLYADTLEGRYRDIITELTEDLETFIVFYRELYPDRETPAWFVLTNEESDVNDYLVVGALVLALLLILTVVYVVKLPYLESRSSLPAQPDAVDLVTRPID